MLNEIETGLKNAEQSLGFEIPSKVADHVLGYTIRKFFRIIERENKPEGYFAALYENEIIDHYVRNSISIVSSMEREESAYVCNM